MKFLQHIGLISNMALKIIIATLIVINNVTLLKAQDQGNERNEVFDSFSTDTFSIMISYEETMPQFHGGDMEFYKYVMLQQQYPLEAKTQGIEGNVVLSFEVQQDGTVNKNSVKVISTPSDLLTHEAIRLIRNSPPWIPATRSKDGTKPVPIKMRISQAIAFRIN